MSGASQETSQEQEVSEEQIDHQIVQPVENSGRQSRKRKSRQFSYEEMTCFINLWSHSQIQNLLTKPGSKSKMWQKISQELAKHKLVRRDIDL